MMNEEKKKWRIERGVETPGVWRLKDDRGITLFFDEMEEREGRWDFFLEDHYIAALSQKNSRFVNLSEVMEKEMRKMRKEAYNRLEEVEDRIVGAVASLCYDDVTDDEIVEYFRGYARETWYRKGYDESIPEAILRIKDCLRLEEILGAKRFE